MTVRHSRPRPPTRPSASWKIRFFLRPRMEPDLIRMTNFLHLRWSDISVRQGATDRHVRPARSQSEARTQRLNDRVGLVVGQDSVLPEIAFAFARLGTQQVATVGLPMFDFAGGGDLETLLHSLVRLLLRHNMLVRRGP